MSQALVTGLNGLSYAFILFLLAAGFSLTFGVMGVLNLTHGALFVFGAYVGLQVIDSVGPFWLAVILAAVSLAVIGFFLYYFFLRVCTTRCPSRRCSPSASATWSPTSSCGSGARGPRSLRHPRSRRRAQGGRTELPYLPRVHLWRRMLVLALLWWIQDRTRWGAIIRAGMDNKEMTVSLGVNYGVVSTAVFLLGGALAGVGRRARRARSSAPIHHGRQPPASDLDRGVVGGTGYIQGTMLGALVIGLLDTFGKAYVPKTALVLRLRRLPVMLLVRPSGLIGRKVF